MKNYTNQMQRDAIGWSTDPIEQEKKYKPLPYKKVFGVKVKKYRIVTDAYCGFECQEWSLFWPFWSQIDFCNSFFSIDIAMKFIESIHIKKVFKKEVVLQ